MSIRYINADLDIVSEYDLSPIVQAFGEAVVVMHDGKVENMNHAAFEIACYENCPETPDEAVARYCELVELFSNETRGVWDGCCSRVIDIAFESGETPKSYSSELKAETVQRLAALGASITITIYPVGAYSDTGASE